LSYEQPKLVQQLITDPNNKLLKDHLERVTEWSKDELEEALELLEQPKKHHKLRHHKRSGQ
jgi:hypothetical protein